MTVTCPNCGSEIPAPKRKKKSIKCPYCDMGGLELGLDYFDEKDNPKQSFSEKHPQIIKVGCLVFTGACIVFDWWMKNKELFVDESAPEMFVSSDSSAHAVEPVTAIDTNEELLAPDSKEAKERLGQRKMHLRVLVNGQKASPEKQAEANEMNIDLQGKYTLVDSCPFHY